MSFRIRKLTGRFNEVVGKKFVKVKESDIDLQELILELQEALIDERAEKKPNQLVVQKLEAKIVRTNREIQQLKKKFS